MTRDLESRADLEDRMAAFYDKLLEDSLLSPKFEGIDLPSHLPRIVDFWESVLFHRPTYSGTPFPAHEDMGLEAPHFDRWLDYFESTLLEKFEGPVTTQTITRSKAVASIFKSKLNL